jgi:hypothetical protein
MVLVIVAFESGRGKAFALGLRAGVLGLDGFWESWNAVNVKRGSGWGLLVVAIGVLAITVGLLVPAIFDLSKATWLTVATAGVMLFLLGLVIYGLAQRGRIRWRPEASQLASRSRVGTAGKAELVPPFAIERSTAAVAPAPSKTAERKRSRAGTMRLAWLVENSITCSSP